MAVKMGTQGVDVEIILFSKTTSSNLTFELERLSCVTGFVRSECGDDASAIHADLRRPILDEPV
jgi:hypothetical protein